MDFFEQIFKRRKRAESTVLIDIGANSVAGAYARYEDAATPSLIHFERLPIEVHEGEPRTRAMLRALHDLSSILVRNGAPALLRAVGSGSADTILVSVDAPWQETTVRTYHFDQGGALFTFTRDLVDKELARDRSAHPDKVIADESVIGTVLNGYETSNPYGRQAHRASVKVLSSLIEREAAEGVITTLRGVFHATNIMPIAGSSLRYQAMRAIFPHERDVLILDATSKPLVSATLVRKGIFAILVEASSPKLENWLAIVERALGEIAKNYPLPRTIFFLAREEDREAFSGILKGADFGSLWLSESPPKIVTLSAQSIAGEVRQTSANEGDIVLTLMTRYYETCFSGAHNTCNAQ